MGLIRRTGTDSFLSNLRQRHIDALMSNCRRLTHLQQSRNICKRSKLLNLFSEWLRLCQETHVANVFK